jgi:hypothetical protein
VDQVCMVIDRDVMGGLPSKIHEEMYRNVNDDARLQAYFEEDKQVRPMHLIHRQRRLRGCMESVCLGVDGASACKGDRPGCSSCPLVQPCMTRQHI